MSEEDRQVVAPESGRFVGRNDNSPPVLALSERETQHYRWGYEDGFEDGEAKKSWEDAIDGRDFPERTLAWRLGFQQGYSDGALKVWVFTA